MELFASTSVAINEQNTFWGWDKKWCRYRQISDTDEADINTGSILFLLGPTKLCRNGQIGYIDEFYGTHVFFPTDAKIYEKHWLSHWIKTKKRRCTKVHHLLLRRQCMLHLQNWNTTPDSDYDLARVSPFVLRQDTHQNSTVWTDFPTTMSNYTVLMGLWERMVKIFHLHSGKNDQSKVMHCHFESKVGLCKSLPPEKKSLGVDKTNKMLNAHHRKFYIY